MAGRLLLAAGPLAAEAWAGFGGPSVDTLFDLKNMPVYVERDTVEPYKAESKVERFFLQGEVRQTDAGPEVVSLNDSGIIQGRHDLALVIVTSDDDFEIRPLYDCWEGSAVEGLGFQEEECCANGGNPSCFGGIFTFHRCCVAAVAGKAFLESSMAAAKRMVAPLLHRYNIDWQAYQRRRMQFRFGEHSSSCSHEGVVPNSQEEPIPKTFAVLGNPETGLRAAFNVLRDAGKAVRKALHVGVNDGKHDDPLYYLIMLEDIAGVGLEANPVLVNKSRQNLPGRFKVVETFVTPKNIWSFAAPIGAMDIVVVDIDSFECNLMETLLDHAIRREKRTGVPLPALLQIEINTMIPPPYMYSRAYSSKDNLEKTQVGQLASSSCSLSYALAAFTRRGYELLFFGYDAVFVRRDLVPLYEQAWGHKFPKDEFECYRDSIVHSCQLPVRYIREWFFRTNDPHDLMMTHELMRSNLSSMSKLDGLDLESMVYASVSALEVERGMRGGLSWPPFLSLR